MSMDRHPTERTYRTHLVENVVNRMEVAGIKFIEMSLRQSFPAGVPGTDWRSVSYELDSGAKILGSDGCWRSKHIATKFSESPSRLFIGYGILIVS
jgi:hypothetical protein